MRPSTELTCSLRATWKLGLLVLLVLLPLLLMACASTKQLAQELKEDHGTFLTPLTSTPAPQPIGKQDVKPAQKPAEMMTADELMADPPKPLQVCSAVPADDLQDLRGGEGVYFFNYNFDINLLNSPQVSVSTTFQAVTPDGSSAPSVNTTSAVFRDSNVSYVTGPTSTGLSSQLLVTGQNNIVVANTQFNIHLPNASVLTPTINVMPGAGLTGLGAK
jgi:hypothetical protein